MNNAAILLAMEEANHYKWWPAKTCREHGFNPESFMTHISTPEFKKQLKSTGRQVPTDWLYSPINGGRKSYISDKMISVGLFYAQATRASMNETVRWMNTHIFGFPGFVKRTNLIHRIAKMAETTSYIDKHLSHWKQKNLPTNPVGVTRLQLTTALSRVLSEEIEPSIPKICAAIKEDTGKELSPHTVRDRVLRLKDKDIQDIEIPAEPSSILTCPGWAWNIHEMATQGNLRT